MDEVIKRIYKDYYLHATVGIASGAKENRNYLTDAHHLTTPQFIQAAAIAEVGCERDFTVFYIFVRFIILFCPVMASLPTLVSVVDLMNPPPMVRTLPIQVIILELCSRV